MQLLIVRHAPAEDLSGSQSDADRELTTRGRKLFRDFVEKIIRPNDAPQLILHSPLVRAVQTAEILREVLGLKREKMCVESRLGPGVTASQMASVCEGLSEERIALVGHNPDVSSCTSRLIGGGSIEFKKGSMACLDFFDHPTVGLGRLVWFMSPKLIVTE